ncbi:MAG: thioredoxin family protein [Acetobacteraceae bacterium]|nr:thioredoxin family protein [Acetobacteraceae bacterium]
MQRPVLALLLALSLGIALPAWAATEMPFTQAAFQAAQKSDEPILVWIHATWCPTCAKQAPILARLEQEPAYQGLKVFKVDFDTQKDVVRAMGVQMQSTLIAFHGSTEQARSTGQTDESALRALVARTAG